METARILASKLKSLAISASSADSDYEKASIYGALHGIKAYFNTDDKKWDTYTYEKVVGAINHISSAIGYETDNGHTRAQHVNWAQGEINTLVYLLESKKQ